MINQSLYTQFQKNGFFINFGTHSQKIATHQRVLIILAHGAGAPANSLFMEWLATTVSKNNIDVMRFNFPYMQAIQTTGKKRFPDKIEKLTEYWLVVLDFCWKLGYRNIFIGGQSLGGRTATLAAAKCNTKLKGILCFAFPFFSATTHKPKPNGLHQLSVPCLIVQGKLDPMGSYQQINAEQYSQLIHWSWIEKATHQLIKISTQAHQNEKAFLTLSTTVYHFINHVMNQKNMNSLNLNNTQS